MYTGTFLHVCIPLYVSSLLHYAYISCTHRLQAHTYPNTVYGTLYSMYCVWYVLCTVCIVYSMYCVRYVLCTVCIVYGMYCVRYVSPHRVLGCAIHIWK